MIVIEIGPRLAAAIFICACAALTAFAINCMCRSVDME